MGMEEVDGARSEDYNSTLQEEEEEKEEEESTDT